MFASHCWERSIAERRIVHLLKLAPLSRLRLRSLSFSPPLFLFSLVLPRCLSLQRQQFYRLTVCGVTSEHLFAQLLPKLKGPVLLLSVCGTG